MFFTCEKNSKLSGRVGVWYARAWDGFLLSSWLYSCVLLEVLLALPKVCVFSFGLMLPSDCCDAYCGCSCSWRASSDSLDSGYGNVCEGVPWLSGPVCSGAPAPLCRWWSGFRLEFRPRSGMGTAFCSMILFISRLTFCACGLFGL